MNKYFGISLLLFLVSSTLNADELRHLSFLTGCWKGEMQGSVVYESWGNLDGNLMLGASKSVSNGNIESFEFLSILPKDGKILYVPYVNGKNSVSFPLANAKAKKAEFANPNHDYPKSILYERNADNLKVVLSGDGPTVEYSMKLISCGD